jgi:hypothetical protein
LPFPEGKGWRSAKLLKKIGFLISCIIGFSAEKEHVGDLSANPLTGGSMTWGF